MVFSSIIFLFYFLPLMLGVYYLLCLPSIRAGRPVWLRPANAFLLLTSLLFYFWGETYLIWIMLVSTLVNYVAGLVIASDFAGGCARAPGPGPRTRKQTVALVVAVGASLGFLAFFKYAGLGARSAQWVLGHAGWDLPGWEKLAHIALPLGISFYTFQLVSYTIDVYRGQAPATRSFIDFACYVTMFPQLVAGPIVRYETIADQLQDRQITFDRISVGVQRFIVGLGKKVLIANTLSGPVETLLSLPSDRLSLVMAWAGAVGYGLQIYFDFSGYSDMAIGMGQMLGFDFLENFRYPYVARSVREFWRRWHISLSTWFRDYLYIPLGGSKCGQVRTYLNLMIVFFLCGLWHGAAWNFALWGLYHGFFLAAERGWLGRGIERLPRHFQHAYTLVVVTFGWAIFAQDNFARMTQYLAAMLGLGHGVGDLRLLLLNCSVDARIAFVAGIVFSMPAAAWLWERLQARRREALERSACFLTGSFTLLTRNGRSLAGIASRERF